MRKIQSLILIFYTRLILISADLINVVPKAEVVRGGSVELSCTTSFGGKYLVEWQHTKVGSSTPSDIFQSGGLNEERINKFRMLIDSDKGEYNLTILNAELNDAGTYACIDMDGAGEQRKTSLIIYDSVPVGISNVSLDQLAICDEEAVHFSLSCSATFKGVESPELLWFQTIKSNGETKLHCTSEITNDTVESHVVVRADPDLNGAYFWCQTKLGKYRWTSSEVQVEYAFKNETRIELQEGSKITCEAHSNRPCRYKWILEDTGKELTDTQNLDLSKMPPGEYTCKAECAIGGNECTVKPMVVKYSGVEHSFPAYAAGAVCLSVGIAVIILVIGLVIFLKRTSAKTTEAGEEVPLLCGGSGDKLSRTPEVEQLIVRGISELGNRLYVIFQGTKFVRVIKDLDKFEKERDITIAGLDDRWGSESCEQQNLFYISDSGKNSCIWKLDPSTSLAEKFITDLKKPHKFSVTSKGQIVIPRWPSQLEIIESDNLERRIIELSNCMLEPYDALLISPNSFIVAHGHQKSTEEGVCLIGLDKRGLSSIEWSYPSNGSDKINNIDEMTLDDENILYVTDQNNQRVIILNIKGERLSHIDTDKLPYRLCYSISHRKLLVGHHGAISIYERIGTGEESKMHLLRTVACISHSLEQDCKSKKPTTNSQTEWEDNTENPIDMGEFVVSGMTELNNKLYVVMQDHPAIRIFDVKKSFKELSSIQTESDPGGNTLSDPWFIDTCSINQCLYITDRKRKCIIKVTNPEKNPRLTQFKTNLEDPFKLSVTSSGMIVVPVWLSSLDIYDAEGRITDTVILPKNIKEPYHAVEIEKSTYIVGHGDKTSELHRVCMVKWMTKTKICQVLWTYGSERGNKIHQLNRPRNVVVDGKGRIFVTDEGNRRIVHLDKDGRLLSMKDKLSKKSERMLYSPTVKEIFVGGYGFIDRYYINEHNHLKFCLCHSSKILRSPVQNI